MMKNTKNPLLPLTNDMIFHAVYGRDTKESKRALIALLNAILEREEDPIVDIKYLNPISYPRNATGKSPNLDIKVLTSSGELIDIEIQVIVKKVYRNRSVFYSARMISDDLERGEDYVKMKKTIVISIMDEELFPETKRCHTVFRFIERTEGFELTNAVSLHFLELSKIDTEKPISEMTEVERLGAYIKYASEDGREEYVQELLMQGEGAVQMADTILRKVSAEDILRERYEAEKKKQYDINTMNTIMAEMKAEAQKEGITQGLAQGMAQGMAQGIRIFIEDKLEDGFTQKEIAEKLQKRFTLEEEEAWKYIRELEKKC